MSCRDNSATPRMYTYKIRESKAKSLGRDAFETSPFPFHPGGQYKFVPRLTRLSITPAEKPLTHVRRPSLGHDSASVCTRWCHRSVSNEASWPARAFLAVFSVFCAPIRRNGDETRQQAPEALGSTTNFLCRFCDVPWCFFCDLVAQPPWIIVNTDCVCVICFDLRISRGFYWVENSTVKHLIRRFN